MARYTQRMNQHRLTGICVWKHSSPRVGGRAWGSPTALCSPPQLGPRRESSPSIPPPPFLPVALGSVWCGRCDGWIILERRREVGAWGRTGMQATRILGPLPCGGDKQGKIDRLRNHAGERPFQFCFLLNIIYFILAVLGLCCCAGFLRFLQTGAVL